MAHLVLRFLGGFGVSLDGVSVTAFGADKARALLAYLAVEGFRLHRRTELSALLWPELPEKNASHNLSQTLVRLRRALGDRVAPAAGDGSAASALIRIAPRDVQLDSVCYCDVARFRELVNQANRHAHIDATGCAVCQQWLHEAAELYRGNFLAGLFVPDSIPFEEWRLVQQESLHAAALDVLERLAAFHEQRAEFEQSQVYARRQLELEPWRETGHLQLMRGLARNGQASAALKQYDVYRRTLDQELGLPPAAAVRTLYEAILAGETKPRPPVAGAGAEGVWLSGAGERRQITTMVCSRASDDEEDGPALVCAAHCARTHQRFGGWRAQRQGRACVVYFGYPTAYEDAAARAVHAALALTASCQECGPVRIGIHTGTVLVGQGHGTRWQERDLLGEAPEIARHLHKLATPGEVLISSESRRLVQEAFEVAPASARAGQDLEVFRVLRESSAATRLDWLAQARRLTPFAGREAELAQLQASLCRATDGDGQAILISGESGIGKSRLVWELRQRTPVVKAAAAETDQPGVSWWTSRCLPYHQNTSLYPIIGLLEQVCGFVPGESLDARYDRVAGLIAQDAMDAPTAAWLRSVLLDRPTGVPSRLTITGAQREQTREMLLTLLRKRAEHRPIVIVIEDLHWADPSTVDWLGLSIDELAAARCLVLLTARPGFQPPWVSYAELRPQLLVQTLMPLPAGTVKQMVSYLADASPLSEGVRQRIISDSDGVPLFVEELTRAVLEEAATTSNPGGRPGVPTTLADSLAARLDRLGPARETAQWAATLGREFSDVLLKAVMGGDAQRTEEDLRRLVAADLVAPLGATPQDAGYLRTVSDAPFPLRYGFRHSLIQEAAYVSLPKRTRQIYHQRVAETIETRFPRLARMYPEVLAEHYANSKQPAKAADYFLAAGESALAQGATLEAGTIYTRALELLEADDIERRWRAHEGRERVHDLRGERVAEKADLEAMMALAETMADDRRRAQVYFRMAGLAGVSGDYQGTLPLAETAVGLARRSGDLAIELQALAYEAQTLLFLGQPEAAGVKVLDALERVAAVDDDSVRALILSLGAQYYSEAGDLLRAIELQGRSLNAAKQSGDLKRELTNQANLALLYSFLGAYDKARDLLEDVVARSELWGHRRLHAASLAQLAHVHLWSDDVARGQACAEKALAELEMAGDAYGAAACGSTLGCILERAGDLTGALQQLQRARTQYAGIGADADRFEAQAFEARVTLTVGDRDAALRLATEVWAYLDANGPEGQMTGSGMYVAVADVVQALPETGISARAVIEMGYRELVRKAESITDPAWQHSFLEIETENRELMARWRALGSGPNSGALPISALPHFRQRS